eukprot:gene9772-13145_t
MEQTYLPQNQQEKAYFDSLWLQSAGEGAVELAGRTAVTFFQQSGVDIGILKQIWSLSTPSASMNISQFYTALRFITMYQNGEIPLTKDRLLQTVAVNLGLPKFNGIPLPTAPPKIQSAAAVPPTLGVSIPLDAAFSIQQNDHTKYHNLFVTYDINNDGYLSRDEAMVIFQKSGVDPGTLNLIWNMADYDKDYQLTSKEFSVAFHIILCISKKGLPLPQALPQTLINFLIHAPAVPPSATGTAPPVAPVVLVNPPSSSGTVPISAPVNTPSHTIGSVSSDGGISSYPISTGSAASTVSLQAPVTQSISSAFDSIQPPSEPIVSSFPSNFNTPQPLEKRPSITSVNDNLSADEVADLSNSLENIRVASKKVITIHEQTLDGNSRVNSSLSSLKQKLARERVSLEASVNNANISASESISRLEATTNEIGSLTEQLNGLRLQLENVQKSQLGTQEQLSRAAIEKQRLQKEIDDMTRQISSANNESQAVSGQLGEKSSRLEGLISSNLSLSAEESQLGKDLSDMGSEIKILHDILSNLNKE